MEAKRIAVSAKEPVCGVLTYPERFRVTSNSRPEISAVTDALPKSVTFHLGKVPGQVLMSGDIDTPADWKNPKSGFQAESGMKRVTNLRNARCCQL